MLAPRPRWSFSAICLFIYLFLQEILLGKERLVKGVKKKISKGSGTAIQAEAAAVASPSNGQSQSPRRVRSSGRHGDSPSGNSCGEARPLPHAHPVPGVRVGSPYRSHLLSKHILLIPALRPSFSASADRPACPRRPGPGGFFGKVGFLFFRCCKRMTPRFLLGGGPGQKGASFRSP